MSPARITSVVAATLLLLSGPHSADAQGQLHTPPRTHSFQKMRSDVLNAVRLKEMREARPSEKQGSTDEKPLFTSRTAKTIDNAAAVGEPKAIQVDPTHNLLVDINEATAFVERQSVKSFQTKQG